MNHYNRNGEEFLYVLPNHSPHLLDLHQY